MKKELLFLILLCVFFGPSEGVAQELHQDLQGTERAEVLSIIKEEERDIIGTDAKALVQTVSARLLSGEQKGEVVVFDNDLAVLEKGDVIFINHIITINGDEYYTFKDADRRGVLVGLGVLLAALLMFFAGRQGLRALVSLVASILAILFLLVPALLAGYPPVLSSVGIAGIVLALILFVTHGVNAR